MLGNLAILAHRQGDDERTRFLWQESLSIIQQCGHQTCSSWALAHLAGWRVRHGAFADAARLLGVAAALHPLYRRSMDPDEREACDASLAAARDALGEAAFLTALKDGEGLTRAQAIAEALASEESARPVDVGTPVSGV